MPQKIIGKYFKEPDVMLRHIALENPDFHFSNLYLALKKVRNLLYDKPYDIPIIHSTPQEALTKGFFFTLSSLGYTICLFNNGSGYDIKMALFRMFRRQEAFNRNCLYMTYVADNNLLYDTIASLYYDMREEFDDAITEEELFQLYSNVFYGFIGVVIGTGHICLIDKEDKKGSARK